MKGELAEGYRIAPPIVIRKRRTGMKGSFPGRTYPTVASPGMPATVNNDVDVFDEPYEEARGGPGRYIGRYLGILREGSIVWVDERNADFWCNVRGDAVPGPGYGWVYGTFLNF